MKILVKMLIIAAIIMNYLYSQQDTSPEFNPDYVKYLELKSKGLWQTETNDGYKLGYIPPPYSDYQVSENKNQINKTKYDKILWGSAIIF